ncbi:MAG: TetR/AcrR family transcriptional regulator [bacterium]
MEADKVSLRQQKKIQARERIVEEADRLFRSQGIAGTTTRQIAERAGISYLTLYNYFPSKALIVHAIIAAEVGLWGAAVDSVIKKYDGHLQQTLADITQLGFDQFNDENMELWRQVSVALFSQSLDETQLISLNQVAHERYHALLLMAQGMGHLDADVDLHLLAHTLYCLTEYAFLLFFLDHNQDKITAAATLREQINLVIGPYQR